MHRLIALSLTLCLGNAVYADGLLSSKQEPVQTPVSEASSVIQGTVTAAPSDAAKPTLLVVGDKDFDKYITVDKLTQPMSSKLTEMYSGYKIIVKSEYPRTLQLQNATITNAVTGSVASKVVRDNPWKGLLWIFVPYLGIILAPVMTISYNTGNGKAKKEGAMYAGQVPTGSLKPGEPLQVYTLVPAGQTPNLTLKFKDKETNQDFILSSI